MVWPTGLYLEAVHGGWPHRILHGPVPQVLSGRRRCSPNENGRPHRSGPTFRSAWCGLSPSGSVAVVEVPLEPTRRDQAPPARALTSRRRLRS